MVKPGAVVLEHVHEGRRRRRAVTLAGLESFVDGLAASGLEGFSLLSPGGNELHVGGYRNEPVFDVEHLGDVNHMLANPRARGVDRQMTFVGGLSREVSDRFLVDLACMKRAVMAFGEDGSMDPSLHWIRLTPGSGLPPWLRDAGS